MTPKSDLDRAIEVVERLRDEWRGSKGCGALNLALSKLRALKEESKG